MSNTKETTKETKENNYNAPKETAKVEKKETNSAVYPAEELASCAKEVFGTKPECVLTALQLEGVKESTVDDAKKIVENFLKKEVE